MKKETKIIILILFTLAAIVCFCIDKEMILAVSGIRNNILDYFFLGITLAKFEILMFFVLTAFFLWNENKKEWIFPLLTCLASSAAVSFLLKVMVQRPRPFQLGLVSLIPQLQDLSFGLWNFSFPSFQSMLVFSAIPILGKEFPKLKKLWILLAILVAFSRIYFGLHFPSDVIIGGIIGYLIGSLAIKTEKENHWGKKIYKKIFKK
jgi:undecaprenyl-diphosphatase